jgi:sec-independent protein translocase protein TatB
MSFGEVLVLLLLAIVVVGPRQLPTMMRTAGRTIARLRRSLFDMRAQSGIDDILRAEGLEREIRELRALMRGNVLQAIASDLNSEIDRSGRPRPEPEPAAVPLHSSIDSGAREYPLAGCDAYGAVAEDLDPYVPIDASGAGADPSGAEAAEESAASQGDGGPIKSPGMGERS